MTNAAKCFLVLASLFFYSWWNIAYLPLILGSMLFNYSLGCELAKTRMKARITKKSILILGIVANLGLLGYFKYTDFLIENFNYISGSHFGLLNLTLPIAISFFTFQQIIYLVDSYRGETKEYAFLNYSVFVAFFPQLISGPIVHHKEMMPQFENNRNKIINHENIAIGMLFFSIGLFKKVVLADTFATWATNGFDRAEILYFFEAWATSLSYTFQLYFDFSGYADMAIGIGLLFNIRLPINFNSPYKSRDIRDFWRRWHITLSRFLRDYVYIPLGGNKGTSIKTYNNLMVTFLIGGIWHGAGWTFVFWGLLHGLALVLQRLWSSFGLKMPNLLAWFITFNFVNLAWVFFRAESFSDALKVIQGMFLLNGFGFSTFPVSMTNQFIVGYMDILGDIIVSKDIIMWLVLGLAVSLFAKNSNEIAAKFRPSIVWIIGTLVILIYSVFAMNQPTEFLYFNF
jgi:D-alanyl-lipoteichoic acid acyltransferase DltB (MBOAT superfamily)|tara:strand:- start:234 stop:1604 length:1371 start_codon:yes stop_codon:yes gene_type:complete